MIGREGIFIETQRFRCITSVGIDGGEAVAVVPAGAEIKLPDTAVNDSPL